MPTSHGLRGNGDFQRYSAAQAVSVLGSNLSLLAFPLLVLSLHGSATHAGAVASCALVARTVCLLPAGQLADRLDRRRLMLGCDLAGLTAIGGVALMVALHTASFALLLSAAVADAMASTFFSPAAAAVVRDIVAEAELTAALGRTQTNLAATGLLGPLLGGWLFTVGPVVPFLCDAASYGLSALLLLGITARPAAAPAGGRTDRRPTAGLRWLLGQPLLLRALLFGAVVNLVGAAAEVAIVVSLRGQGTGGSVIGLVMAGSGVGALVGAVVSSRLIRLVGPTRLLVAIGAGWTAGFVVLAGCSASAWVVGSVMVVLFTLSPAAAVVIGQALLSQAPRELLGRVGTATTLLLAGLSALGPLLAGAGFQAVGVPCTWLLLSGLTVTATLVAGPPLLRQRGLLARSG